MYIHTCRYIERERILLVQALSRKIRPGTNLMTKVFQILTRNLSKKPNSIFFFGDVAQNERPPTLSRFYLNLDSRGKRGEQLLRTHAAATTRHVHAIKISFLVYI